MLLQQTGLTSAKKRKVQIEIQEKIIVRQRQELTENRLQITEVTSIEAYADCLFRTDKSKIHGYCDNDKKITIYNEYFKPCETIQLDFEVFDMSCSSNQDIIATDWNGCRVIEISRSGKTNILVETSPLKPGGMCINDNGNIVVGLCAGYGILPIKLVVYSANFGVLQEIEHDAAREPLFTNKILQVKQNGNGDYIVSDDYRIICISRGGELRWEYMIDFVFDDVCGVVCDKYDNIIISHRLSFTISVLDSEGSHISTLMTKKDGILYPKALAIDSNGRLWIGHYDKVKVVKYIK